MSAETLVGRFFMIRHQFFTTWASKIGGNAFLVYCVLLMHANQQGTCCVSWRRIMKLTGLTRSCVDHATRSLRSKGIIETEFRGSRAARYALCQGDALPLFCKNLTAPGAVNRSPGRGNILN